MITVVTMMESITVILHFHLRNHLAERREAYFVKEVSMKRLPKKKLDYYARKLSKIRKELVDVIDGLERPTLKVTPREATGDLSNYAFHMADIATANSEREKILNLRSGEERLLYAVDEVLYKIKQGTYGICERCKIMISEERLRAIPYARLCVKCKEELEKAG